MYREVKTVGLTKARNPESLRLINEYASLQDRKANDLMDNHVRTTFPELIKRARACQGNSHLKSSEGAGQ